MAVLVFPASIVSNWCRIQTYLQSTRPIIELYQKQGKVRTIDASRSVDEVGTKLHAIIIR